MIPASLPTKAVQKFQSLEDAADEARELLATTTRRISELNRALGTASTESAANLEHEISRLRAKSIEQQQRSSSRVQTFVQVREWLKGLPAAAEFEAYRGRPSSGGNRKQVLARVRDEIGALRREKVRVHLASPTVDELKVAAAEYAKVLAARGAPKVVIEHDKFDLSWAAETFGKAKPTPAEIFAWFDPETVARRLGMLIDERAVPENAMTKHEKAERLAEIEVNIAALELEEEQLIERAEADGQSIERRADASPAAILGLAVVNRWPKATVAA